MREVEAYYADYLLEDGRWVWENSEPASDYPAFDESYCDATQQFIVDHADDDFRAGDADLFLAMFESAEKYQVAKGVHSPHIKDCLRDNTRVWSSE
jgi:hypothetical protein